LQWTKAHGPLNSIVIKVFHDKQVKIAAVMEMIASTTGKSIKLKSYAPEITKSPNCANTSDLRRGRKLPVAWVLHLSPPDYGDAPTL